MAEPGITTYNLKVAEALPKDAGKMVARIDPDIMGAIKVEVGERIAIRGPKNGVAKALPTYPDKRGQGLIQIWRGLRQELGVNLGDIVQVAKLSGKLELGPTRQRYSEIGGLEKEIQKVREMVELPLKYPRVFEHLGIEAPKGVLLYGPPGVGKTLIARAVAKETDAYFIHVNGPEVIHKYYGESEAKLREIFDRASRQAPSIIFLDEIDAIAPKREEVTGEVEKRVVAQLLALMDGLKSRGQVVVIAATNLPNLLDPALRRPGRFDREIAIGIPDQKSRHEILKIHSRTMPLGPDVDLSYLSQVTHGFVGADLAALCKEAAMRSLRELMEGEGISDRLFQEKSEGLIVTMKHFIEALKEIEPSATREFIAEIPLVKWSDIGGLDNVKEQLREAVEWPLKFSTLFARAAIEPPKGILFFGPPGTGKTLVAKALAHETEANFILVKGPELLSKWVGETEKAIRQIFKKAKQTAPCIVFIDEIDTLAPARGMGGSWGINEKVIGQLLTEMDGVEELHGVLVLAATNRRDVLDPALLRPGRFDLQISFAPPDKEGRKAIFKVHTRNKPLGPDIDLELLAEKSPGLTGADIRRLCQLAAMAALREFINKNPDNHRRQEGQLVISMEHFHTALEKVKEEAKIEGASRKICLRSDQNDPTL